MEVVEVAVAVLHGPAVHTVRHLDDVNLKMGRKRSRGEFDLMIRGLKIIKASLEERYSGNHRITLCFSFKPQEGDTERLKHAEKHVIHQLTEQKRLKCVHKVLLLWF